MHHLSIALLGPMHVAVDGVEVADFGYLKVRALLVYLAVEQRKAHERDVLAELLWPEQPPQVGRSSLRQALARLRRAIGDGSQLLLAERDTLRLASSGDYMVDVASFEALAKGAGHSHAPNQACAECVALWRQAVELYRGPFADGAVPRDAPAFEEWAHAQRERLARLQFELLARLAAHDEARGEHALSLANAARQLELEPWHEPAHRAIMRALAAQGRRGAALDQYERLCRVLADELGVEPEPETVDLCAAIRSGALRAETPTGEQQRPAFDDPPALEHGDRRRGDDSAEHASFSSLAPLPIQSTSFIGREPDLRALLGLLDDPECRLVTLLGPGGIGKTRLAVRLVQTAAVQYRDGVAWLSLAALRSSVELPAVLAAALGCSAADGDDALGCVRELLRSKELLLVLDNLEHLPQASELIADLLASAPRLCVIATSRERLDLRSEWVYELAGLAYPTDDGAGAENSAAVQLLLERARQVSRLGTPDAAELAAAVRIARMVEGSPLALELAAATCRNRSFAAIAGALEHDLDLLRASFRDLPERHRSIRAALDGSWRLLLPSQQHAMGWLSVFRGGFSAPAAQTVAGISEHELDELAGKSMLRCVGGRWDMHELVRRYASDRLSESGELRTARTAHLFYLVSVAEAAEPHFAGAEQEHWLGLLEHEGANTEAALAWAIDERLAEPAQRLGAALTRFWWMRGRLREGREWLERGLALDTDVPSAVRARALNGAGMLAMQQADHGAARVLLEQSLGLERIVGRQAELVRVLNNLALLRINAGEYDDARTLIAECLEIDRALDDRRGVAYDLGMLAQLAYHLDDFARAAELYAESLELHRQVGDRHSVGISLLNLGASLRLAGRAAEARATLEEGLAVARSMEGTLALAYGLLQYAFVVFSDGDTPLAREQVVECLPLLSGLGDSSQLAMALVLLARIELAEGATARGVGLWGTAARLIAERNVALQLPDQHEYDQQLALARAAVEPSDWDIWWQAGSAMSPEQAMGDRAARQ